MPSSTTRRRSRFASSGSSGGPQIPGPVIRMAPNPRRWTSRSPPMVKVSMRLTLATPNGRPRYCFSFGCALSPGDAQQQELPAFALVGEVGLTVGVVVVTRRLLHPERVCLHIDQEHAGAEGLGGVDYARGLPGALIAGGSPVDVR